MEIFELRYFLEVARLENIHRASERLHVSPGSLSKAITRIEDELKVALFSREGRNIRLTDPGKVLKLRASELIELEESTRMEISGHLGQVRAVLAGPEVFLSKMGLAVTQEIQKRHPLATFEFHACDEWRAIEQVMAGEAHLALISGEVPPELTSKVLAETQFVTVVGAGHPLHASARAKKSVPVEEVLKHPFVSPSHPILGKVGLKQSLDGWRDDKFTRKVAYLTTSLKLLESLVTSGRALAYLPDSYAEDLDVLILKVAGCPYTCSQKIKLVARRPKNVGWLGPLFH